MTTLGSKVRDEAPNVRSAAVEKAAAPVAPSLATVVRQAIDKQASAFAAVLPAGTDPDRFGRLVVTAVKATPQLMECFATPQGQTTVLLAAMQAAAVGLEPNTPTQEAWLLPRRNKGVMEAQLSIGYRGYLKLARRSGEVLDIWAEVVKEGDEFDYVLGLHRDLTHRPASAAQRGDNTHAYAVVRYKDGGLNFVVLDRADVEARRAKSDSFRHGKDYSPWTTSPDAMWRKSALRALVPYLPLAAQAASAIASDEAPLAYDDDAGVIQATTVDEDDTPELMPGPDAA